MSWKDTALQHAKKDAPYEACGLLAIHKGKEKYYPCKNIAEDLTDQFIIVIQIILQQLVMLI